MVVDTSAVLAIFQNEPEAERFARCIVSSPRKWMSAANFMELSILVLSRFGDRGVRDLDLLISKLGLQISSVTPEQVLIARRAFRDYGKGRHAAGLNFGDCFSYALSKDVDEPLLFKGDDFSRTDVTLCADV